MVKTAALYIYCHNVYMLSLDSSRITRIGIMYFGLDNDADPSYRNPPGRLTVAMNIVFYHAPVPLVFRHLALMGKSFTVLVTASRLLGNLVI